MMPAIEVKYNYLISRLSITDIDLWEKDACISLNPIYFQFNACDVLGQSVDDVLNKLVKEKT
jgi:hypothetical protein